MRYATWTLTLAAAFVALPGCALEKKDGADRFREAIPRREAVVVPGPESAAEPASRTQALGPGNGVQAAGAPAGGAWAKYYGFTREVRDGVNHVTGGVLGLVWIIVHTQPTKAEGDEAIWGPYTDALEPAAWRFRIREVAPDEFDYAFEGRPKSSNAESDYVPVISGKGWAKGHNNHGDGYFEIDLDAGRALDPFHYDNESGKVKITHDLPPSITDDLAALPKLVRAEIHPSSTTQWFDVTSHALADRTGTLDVEAFADTDDDSVTRPEDIQIQSRWRASGAGRADITLSGGDVPAALGVVTAVECWSEEFSRVYYSDSVSYQPLEGDPARCAYPDP